MRWAGFGFGFLPAGALRGGAVDVGTGVAEVATGEGVAVMLSSVTCSFALTALSSFVPLISTLFTSTPSVDASTTAAAVEVLVAPSINGAKGLAVADRV